MSDFAADVMNNYFSLQLQTDTNFFHGVVENGVFFEAVCFFICWISTIQVISIAISIAIFIVIVRILESAKFHRKVFDYVATTSCNNDI